MFDEIKKAITEAREVAQRNLDNPNLEEARGKGWFGRMRIAIKEARRITKLETEKRIAEQKKQAETKPKEAEYNWNEVCTYRVNMYTLASLFFTTLNVIFYFYQFWIHKLFTVARIEACTYAIAELWAICWAVCWWRKLCPKLVTAKNPWEHAEIGWLFILLFLPLDIILLKGGLTSLRTTMCFLLGALYTHIAVVFISVWHAYRRSKHYKKLGFIEFCNTPVSNRE